MATVAQKVFFAHLYDEAGTLARIDNALVFFSDAGEITTVEPADVNFLVVLGEVGLANARQIVDRLAGGYAKIATSRLMEVA